MTDLQKMGDDVVRSLSKAASENPLSAALIGAGVLWMMAGASRPALTPLSRVAASIGSAAADPLTAVRNAAVEGVAAAGEAATSATGAVQQALSEGGSVLTDVSNDLHQRTSAFANDARDSGGQMASGLKQTLSHLFEQQPLALAAVGLAIGAGIAAAIPTSDIEQEIMGKSSEDLASFVSDRTKEVKDAVLNEAREQGLTPDAVSEATQTIVEKAKLVVTPGSDSAAQV